jgi:phage protein U
MLLFGPVLFSVNTVSYDQIVRTARFNWSAQSVIGRQPVYQYLGYGERAITLEGVIYPGRYGELSHLMLLEQTAGLGLPMPLFSVYGYTLGAWCVTSYQETGTELMDNGQPRKINFTVSLLQYASLLDYLTEYASDYLKGTGAVGSYMDILADPGSLIPGF